MLPRAGFPAVARRGEATREDGAGFDHRTTAGGVREALGEALRVAPGLADATLREVRVGFRPVNPDRLPLLGRAGPAQRARRLRPAVRAYSGAVVAESLQGRLGLAAGIDPAPYAPARCG